MDNAFKHHIMVFIRNRYSDIHNQNVHDINYSDIRYSFDSYRKLYKIYRYWTSLYSVFRYGFNSDIISDINVFSVDMQSLCLPHDQFYLAECCLSWENYNLGRKLRYPAIVVSYKIWIIWISYTYALALETRSIGKINNPIQSQV